MFYLPTALHGEQYMSIVGWVVFGLIAGFIASRVVNNQGEGCILNVTLGLVGAVVGGFIFSTLGGAHVTGFNIYSIFVAIIGAVVVLVLYHVITGRRTLR
jgi:uncharacterized membrane protein YeaQ/YmgE (transglycosylase-associated protein family)